MTGTNGKSDVTGQGLQPAANIASALLMVLASAACGCQGLHELGFETSKAVHRTIDRPDVAAAAKRVQSPDPDIRREAVLELGRGGVRDVETLKKVLELLTAVLQEDEEPLMRAAAAASLGNRKQRAATINLVAALKDDSPLVRQEVLRALVKIHDPDAVPALVLTLEMDPAPEVRTEAATALGQFEGATIPPTLVKALDDKSLSVRSAASEALQEISGKSYGLDKERWQQWLVEDIPNSK